MTPLNKGKRGRRAAVNSKDQQQEEEEAEDEAVKHEEGGSEALVLLDEESYAEANFTTEGGGRKAAKNSNQMSIGAHFPLQRRTEWLEARCPRQQCKRSQVKHVFWTCHKNVFNESCLPLSRPRSWGGRPRVHRLRQGLPDQERPAGPHQGALGQDGVRTVRKGLLHRGEQEEAQGAGARPGL